MLSLSVIGVLISAHSASAFQSASGKQSAPGLPPQAAFGIGPAGAKGLDGRAYLNFLASPGGTGEDHIAVVNLSTRALAVAVYAVDARTASDGSLTFAPRADRPMDAGAWISVGGHRRDTVVVPGRSKRLLPIHVTVPANAQPGDHAAAVIASITARAVGAGGASETLGLEQRVALRAYFRISGVFKPQLEVQHLRVDTPAISWNPFAGRTAVLTYTVRNTGNVRLGAHQEVGISGLFGKTTVRAPDVPELYPGGAVQYRVIVNGVHPELRMTARVVLTPLVVAGDVDPGLPASFQKATTFWFIPWSLLTAILVLGGLAGAGLRRRSRRRAHTDAGRTDMKEEQPA